LLDCLCEIDETIGEGAEELAGNVVDFVVHLLVVGDIEAHVVVFKFREAEVHPAEVLDLDKGGEDSQPVLFV